MSSRDIVIDEFKLLLQENLRNINMIIKTAELLGITNEQYFLDWENEINSLSVKDHSI